ncbi:unnamed protein product [Cylicostephanus goldi]|uniref:Uncharacterized protein n=1 Tax=Cylicostephanus goldi TaxID=71465 RepID=A0A3P6T967_CYLGO|nr:unnamed protein product [Cylicostephanus goldi]
MVVPICISYFVLETVVRRSGRSVARKDYSMKQESDDGSSSSSPPSSASDSIPLSEKEKSEENTESDDVEEEADASYDSDESFDVVPPKRAKTTGAKQSGRKQATKGGGKAGSAKSRSSAGSGTGRKSSKAPAATALPHAPKPVKPWQKTGEPAMEGDINVPPRKLRKGEKKMLKYRCVIMI